MLSSLLQTLSLKTTYLAHVCCQQQSSEQANSLITSITSHHLEQINLTTTVPPPAPQEIPAILLLRLPQHQSIPPVIMNIFGHVYKYEAVLWSLEKLRKTIFCYKMIHFSLRKLRFSGNMYFSYLERLALAKVEKVLQLQGNDKKVTLLLIYHISGF